MLAGILSIAVISNYGYMVTAQSITENTSNLTNPNNPTLKLDESYNQTSEQGNNSNESTNNLPSPM